ncbi:MAG: DUF4350 domain-containing protein [Microbacterium sp.]|nr:DUF4350 domain-containing protein [Microbacterium sp.]
MSIADIARPLSPSSAEPSPPRRRRVGGWIAITIVLVVVGLLGAALSGVAQWDRRDTLDPDSAGPDGGRALAHLLSDRGVTVSVVRDRAAALAAARAGGATLLLPDSPYLSDAVFTELADAADAVVVAQPQSRGVRLLFPGARVAGYGDATPVAPACSLPAARRSGAIVAGAVFTSRGDVTSCYTSGDGAALLQRRDGDRRITVIDASELFTNAHLAEHGNAALGVNLLGALRTVVWYVPTAADSDRTGAAPSIGDLTPGWVSPAIALLLIAGLVAGLWRGRRFGPLVSETLPVTVRAAETTEGRARLYARSRDAVHAADRLRVGALRRLARLLALGPAASADEISDAVADRVATPRAVIRDILIDGVPRSDRELVALSDRLRDLEAAVRAAVRSPGAVPAESERNRP